MSNKNEFDYSEKLSAEEVADYLAKFAAGLKTGNLMMQGKGQSIALTPGETVKLGVKAENKEGKGGIEFEISWKEEYTVGSQKLVIESTQQP